ncbi:MAG: hypothetical protein IAF08_12240 [Rhizobacter sp.]|nr:hypothetical protein [Chlorobiales bacterium]
MDAGVFACCMVLVNTAVDVINLREGVMAAFAAAFAAAVFAATGFVAVAFTDEAGAAGVADRGFAVFAGDGFTADVLAATLFIFITFISLLLLGLDFCAAGFTGEAPRLFFSGFLSGFFVELFSTFAAFFAAFLSFFFAMAGHQVFSVSVKMTITSL